jgi:hypothetical protein
MDMGSPSVVAAMQAPLRVERRVFSEAHDYEHAFEYERLHKLEGWYNDLVADARNRRRRLLRQIFALGGTPDPDAGDPESVPAGVGNQIGTAFANTMTMFSGLWQAYQGSIEAAVGAKDQDTLKILSKNQRQVRKTICCIEARQKILSSVGDAIYKATKA